MMLPQMRGIRRSSPSVNSFSEDTLHDVIKRGDLQTIQRNALSNPQYLLERNSNQATALHTAAKHHQSQITEWILALIKVQKLAIDINAVDVDGNSALHLALIVHDLQSAQALLKADVHSNQPNKIGKTPLFLLFHATESLAITSLPVCLFLGPQFHLYTDN
jgi:ankyrin repeat protein